MKYLELNYVFDASAKTVQFLNWPSGTLKKEGILLITNVEDGIIVYNFADPAKGGTLTPDGGGDILTLDYDTTSMDDTDPLQIWIDDPSATVMIDDAGGSLTVDGTVAISNASIPVTDNGGSLTVDSAQLPSSPGQNIADDSLSVVIASDQTVPVSSTTLALETGGNLTQIATALQVIDNFISGSRGLVTEDNSASIKTAVEIIDNFISGSRGLVTEDNSASIKTAVEVIDNFISGSRGLVTEDNSGSIKTSVELIDDAIIADDAAFTPAVSKVMMAGATFDDSSPDSVNEGDAGALRMSANRALYVMIRDAAGNERGLNIDASGQIAVASHPVTNAGTFAVQESGTHIQVDDAAFTPATSKVDMIGATFDDSSPDSVDEGDGGAVRMSGNRNLYVRIRDNAGNERGLNIDANGEFQISGIRNAITVSSHAVTNAGTFAVQAASAGDVAHDTGDSGNPVKSGAKAISSLKTTTLVSSADRTDNQSDLDGALIVRDQFPLGDLISERVSDTGGTSTAFTNFSAVSGTKNYITAIHAFNTSASAGYVDFRDGTGGAILYSVIVPAGGGCVLPGSTTPYFKTSANTALAYDVSGALSTVYISISGFQSKL